MNAPALPAATADPAATSVASSAPHSTSHSASHSTNTAAIIEWNDRLLLGYPEMDDEHRDFVACVSALQQCADADVGAHLDAFAAHARRHFGAEDGWMQATDFPARQCHIDEHAAVLKSVAEVQAVVASGRVQVARSLADELARWFPGHADYLDSALAAWMCKRRWNAQPLVLRRNLAVPATAIPAPAGSR